MKSKAIASILVISLLGPSAAAFAEPHGRAHPGAHGPAHPGARGPARPAAHRPAPRPPERIGRDMRAPGAIPHRDWHRGDRLPSEYRGYNYAVDDWRSHGLSAPPRGYQWLGINGDYVLAAIATGVIASVLISGAR